MDIAIAGFQYFLAVLVGLIVAVFPTLLVSWAIFPSDGPVGEGLTILFIHILACCALVPAYVYLMTLHRRGAKSPKERVYDHILRGSVIVAGCFFCFMAVKLPTMMMTKLIACLVTLALCAWAAIPALWNRIGVRYVAVA